MHRENSESHGLVYVVDGARTPFLKARGVPGPFSASDLAVKAGQALLDRQGLYPHSLDEVVIGSVMSNPDETNVARLIALRLGCPLTTPAYTVQRNCASGLQAIDSAMKDIRLGKADLVLAGGTEAMSHAPLLFQPEMAAWLGTWMGAKNFFQHLLVLKNFRLKFLKPIISLLNGLNDPMYGISMGQTAENLAFRFEISRLAMDTFSVQSHERYLKSFSEKEYEQEIIPIVAGDGRYYDTDDGVRKNTNVERLATLKPFFDKTYGVVTAGNSSQVTDGAALLLLASQKAVEEMNLPVLGVLVDVHWAGLDPREMGLGPVHATLPLLKENHLSFQDIDYWEINEAFSAQVLACVKAFQDKDYLREHWNDDSLAAVMDEARLNIDGGAIAMGHPVGASGARLVLHLLEILKRKEGKRGIAALCIGGGQGGAILVESMDKKIKE